MHVFQVFSYDFMLLDQYTNDWISTYENNHTNEMLLALLFGIEKQTTSYSNFFL